MDLNHRVPLGSRIYSPVQSTAMRYLHESYIIYTADSTTVPRSGLRVRHRADLLNYNDTITATAINVNCYLVETVGIEPTPFLLMREAYKPFILRFRLLVPTTGNDPVSIGYQPIALPLSYAGIQFTLNPY